jgi:hypothetical protein
MYKKLMFAVALVAGLAACRDVNRNKAPDADAPAATNVAAEQPPAPAAAPAPAAVPVVSSLKEPLAGGVRTLPFKYHVAVEHDVTVKKTGKTSREVGLEFLEGNVLQIDGQVAAEFEKVGYRRDAGQAQGNAIRSLYKKAGSPDVLVWVRPGAPRGERFKLQQPGAMGTVYLAWSVDKQ